MHLSIKKLPALFDLVFLFITFLEIIALFFLCVSSQDMTLQNFFTLYGTVAGKIFWIFLVGILLHIISYVKSLDNNWLLFANICGIFAYLTFWILPNYFPIAVILLWLSIYNLMSHAKPNSSHP
ncbi:hypothetical protein [Agrilactobacillus yilanensis]|uniref:hypothetical protein n=1 Tax=Agrilactobacillus yilanensis TaxID=2485997 RepID=UPI000F78450B